MIIRLEMEFRMPGSAKSRIVFFSAFFLLAQMYFVVLSTHHAFMDMPATCPVCAMVNQYDDVITAATVELSVNSFSQFVEEQLPDFEPLFNSSFQPRAPPLI